MGSVGLDANGIINDNGTINSNINLPATGSAPAAVLTGPYGDGYTIKELPIPTPGVHDALVQLEYSGVCHGDVYARDGGGPAPKDPVRPLIGGHEGVGRIVSLGSRSGTGSESESSDAFRVGDVVGVAWRSQVCGTCQACAAGAENHCFDQKVTGSHRDGTFQRYISFPTSQLVRIPPGVSLPSVCPILCAGVTAYSALKRMDPQPGRWCTIVGAAGGLGHLAIQYAKAMDLNVLAIDGGSADKEDFCMKMGADVFVDFAKPGLVETIVAKTGGGADYILVLSPHQSSYE
jgi:propanol-preferring alcohol dehydrogenase